MAAHRWGLASQVLEKINSIFSRYPDVEKVILYGSRAKGNFKAGSDIDLTIVGNKITLSDLLKIENDIDDLLLPYKIDLSLMSQIQDQQLLGHIQRVGVVFYQK